MLSRAERKRIRGLRRRRNREREGLFLAEGVRVVEELLSNGFGIRLAALSPGLEQTERGRALAARLSAATDARRVSDGDLTELGATVTTQGVLAVAEIPAPARDDFGTDAGSGPVRGPVLVLDGVQDPGNLGTLARSAAAFGCHGLLCLPGTVDPWNPKAVRGSAGTLFRLAVAQVDWETFDDWRREHGWRMVGADAAGTPVRSLPGDDVALVVGNEGAGLSREAVSRCEAMVAVPMRAGTESLNVAIAGSLLLYELNRGEE